MKVVIRKEAGKRPLDEQSKNVKTGRNARTTTVCEGEKRGKGKVTDLCYKELQLHAQTQHSKVRHVVHISR